MSHSIPKRPKRKPNLIIWEELFTPTNPEEPVSRENIGKTRQQIRELYFALNKMRQLKRVVDKLHTKKAEIFKQVSSLSQSDYLLLKKGKLHKVKEYKKLVAREKRAVLYAFKAFQEMEADIWRVFSAKTRTDSNEKEFDVYMAFYHTITAVFDRFAEMFNHLLRRLFFEKIFVDHWTRGFIVRLRNPFNDKQGTKQFQSHVSVLVKKFEISDAEGEELAKQVSAAMEKAKAAYLPCVRIDRGHQIRLVGDQTYGRDSIMSTIMYVTQAQPIFRELPK